MRKGELSNRQVAHVMLVFEGTLGYLDKENIVPFRAAIHEQQFQRAVDLWNINDLMCRAIWDAVFRRDVMVEVVTFVSQEDEYIAALEERITDDEDLPVRKVLGYTEEKLMRSLPYRPEVAAVYTPSEAMASQLGSKGRWMRVPADLGR